MAKLNGINLATPISPGSGSGDIAFSVIKSSLTGSLFTITGDGATTISGSLTVTGSLTAGSFTGSITGTASYATQALSASFSRTASYVLNAVSASYATQALSASYATQTLSSSYALSASRAISTAAVTGTTNYIPKFTSGTTIGNSQIFDNGTYVGIGTTSPSYYLDVFGNSRIRSLTGYDVNLLIEANVSNYYALLNIKSGDGTTWGIGTCQYQYSNAFLIRSGASGSERLVISTTGNVGIGTVSPTAKLHVAAPGALSTDIGFKVRNSADTADIITVAGNGNVNLENLTLQRSTNLQIQLAWQLNQGAGNSIVVSRSNYGVGDTIRYSSAGTWNPLGVGTSNFAGFSFTDTIAQTGSSTGTSRALYVNPTLTSATDWRSIEWTNNTGFGLYGSGDAVNYLKSGLGIGKTTPNAKLDVSGSAIITGSLNVTQGITGSLLGTSSYATQALSSSFATSTSAVTGTTNYIPKFTSANTLGNSVIFESGSNIGIGTTSPSAKLNVAGTLTVASTSSGAQSYNVLFSKNIAGATGAYNSTTTNTLAVTATTSSGFQSAALKNTLSIARDASYNYTFGHEWSAMTNELVMGSYGSIPYAADVIANTVISTTNGYTRTIGTLYDMKFNYLNYGTVSTHYGIYHDASDARHYFAGNIGIGTTSPSAKLHIVAPGALVTDLGLRVRNSANTGDLLLVTGNGIVQTGVGGLAIPRADTPGGTNNATITHRTDGTFGFSNNITIGKIVSTTSQNSYIQTDGQQHIYQITGDGNSANGFIYRSYVAQGLNSTSYNFFTVTNGTDNMFVIKANGNIGIGKTTPNAKLDVSGSAIITGSLNVTQGITGSLLGTSSYSTQALSSSYADTASYYGGSVTSASYATTASYVLNAVSASYSTQALSASFATSTTAVAGTANYVPKFATSTTLGNSVIFESGSNIGIGTTSPSAKLHVTAPGALSTDIGFKVRNSADTADLFNVKGDGSFLLSSSGTIDGVFIGTKNNLNSSLTSVYFGQNSGTNITNAAGTAFNVFIGGESGRSYTTVRDTVAIGYNTLRSAVTGCSGNVAIGNILNESFSSLGTLTSGNYNTAIGGAFAKLATGSANIGIGTYSGYNILTGTNNTFIGHSSGNNAGFTSGNNNTFIGANTTSNSNVSNKVLIGDGQGNQRIQIFSNGNTLIGYSNNSADPGAKLNIIAPGALSTDIAFKVRNSADTTDWFKIDGTGAITLNNAIAVNSPILTFAKLLNGSGYFYADASSYLTWSTQLKIDGTLLLVNGIAMQGYGKNISMNYGTMTGGSSTSMVGPASISLRPDFNLATVENSTSLFIAPDNTANPTKKLIKLMDSTLTNTFFTVNGLGQVGIGTNSPTKTLQVVGTTSLSSSFNTAVSGSTLSVYGSGSAQPVFTVQGSQGELFSVTDSLSGSLFSVNDISGLPIMEVFSDNTTLMGSYQDPMLITTTKLVTTASGAFTLYSLPTASYDTAFFEYSIRSGSNARAGSIMAMQLGSTVNFTETTTTDFGSTSGFGFTVQVAGANMRLTGSATTSGWTIKTIVRSI